MAAYAGPSEIAICASRNFPQRAFTSPAQEVRCSGGITRPGFSRAPCGHGLPVRGLPGEEEHGRDPAQRRPKGTSARRPRKDRRPFQLRSARASAQRQMRSSALPPGSPFRGTAPLPDGPPGPTPGQGRFPPPLLWIGPPPPQVADRGHEKHRQWRKQSADGDLRESGKPIGKISKWDLKEPFPKKVTSEHEPHCRLAVAVALGKKRPKGVERLAPKASGREVHDHPDHRRVPQRRPEVRGGPGRTAPRRLPVVGDPLRHPDQGNKGQNPHHVERGLKRPALHEVPPEEGSQGHPREHRGVEEVRDPALPPHGGEVAHVHLGNGGDEDRTHAVEEPEYPQLPEVLGHNVQDRDHGVSP